MDELWTRTNDPPFVCQANGVDLSLSKWVPSMRLVPVVGTRVFAMISDGSFPSSPFFFVELSIQLNVDGPNDASCCDWNAGLPFPIN